MLEEPFLIVFPSIYICVYNDKKKKTCYRNTLLIYTNYLEYIKSKHETSVWDYRKRQRSNTIRRGEINYDRDIYASSFMLINH